MKTKSFLFKELNEDILALTPFNYRYIFSRTSEEIGKSKGKFVSCNFYPTNKYSVSLFYKPISTTLPKDLSALENE
jgi:hypothetical protein